MLAHSAYPRISQMLLPLSLSAFHSHWDVILLIVEDDLWIRLINSFFFAGRWPLKLSTTSSSPLCGNIQSKQNVLMTVRASSAYGTGKKKRLLQVHDFPDYFGVAGVHFSSMRISFLPPFDCDGSPWLIPALSLNLFLMVAAEQISAQMVHFNSFCNFACAILDEKQAVRLPVKTD